MKRVLLIVGVVVLVGTVAVLGAWRPNDGTGFSPEHPGSAIEGLGGLVPVRSVSAAELSGQPCWDSAGTLTVPAGAQCTSAMPPEAKRISLCLASGVPSLISVRGSRYGGQSVKPGSVPCASEHKPIDLYDDNSVLIVGCSIGAPCVLRLS